MMLYAISDNKLYMIAKPKSLLKADFSAFLLYNGNYLYSGI